MKQLSYECDLHEALVRLWLSHPTQAEWGLRKAQNSNNGLIEAAHNVE